MRKPVSLSVSLLLALAGLAAPVRAAPNGRCTERLPAVLLRGDPSLVVSWDVGPPQAERRRVRIELGTGNAGLSRCPPGGACVALVPGPAAGAPVVLSAGERDRVLSGLRAANLTALRSAPPEQQGAADRALSLQLGGGPCGTWSLPRAEWPAPPGGDKAGLAAFLDELAERLGRTAPVPVSVPASVAELSRVRIKLHLFPATLPGGTLVLERGVASVTPEEGARERVPRPGPFERRLTAEELERLMQALKAADLDHLEDRVPRREAPAIGDDDGRLVTLHLLPPEEGSDKDTGQPRGLRRYLADLRRSPARPMVDQLVEIVLSPPARPLPLPRSVMDVVGRDDLVLTWEAPGRDGTRVIDMATLPDGPREELRQAVIIAAPYLTGRPRKGERVLVLAVPWGPGRERLRAHVVGAYGGGLAGWQRGPTARLAGLLERYRTGALSVPPPRGLVIE